MKREDTTGITVGEVGLIRSRGYVYSCIVTVVRRKSVDVSFETRGGLARSKYRIPVTYDYASLVWAPYDDRRHGRWAAACTVPEHIDIHVTNCYLSAWQIPSPAEHRNWFKNSDLVQQEIQ